MFAPLLFRRDDNNVQSFYARCGPGKMTAEAAALAIIMQYSNR